MGSENFTAVQIFTMPQEMPCGPASTCCGPVGQTEQEITKIRREIEAGLPGIQVEVVNIRQKKLRLREDGPVLKVLGMFGAAALPVLAVNGEVVSIGPTEPDQLVALLRAKLSFAS